MEVTLANRTQNICLQAFRNLVKYLVDCRNLNYLSRYKKYTMLDFLWILNTVCVQRITPFWFMDKCYIIYL